MIGRMIVNPVYPVHMHLWQGGCLYRIDDHSTDHHLVLLFRYEVSGSGGILPGNDYGDERHSHFNTSSFVDLYHQAKIYQWEEGLSSGNERNFGVGICVTISSHFSSSRDSIEGEMKMWPLLLDGGK